jgi:hypothetical protein
MRQFGEIYAIISILNFLVLKVSKYPLMPKKITIRWQKSSSLLKDGIAVLFLYVCKRMPQGYLSKQCTSVFKWGSRVKSNSHGYWFQLSYLLLCNLPVVFRALWVSVSSLKRWAYQLTSRRVMRIRKDIFEYNIGKNVHTK